MTDNATRDDETPEEAEQAAETGETPDEAHRAGEYDEVRDLLESVIRKIDALTSFVTDARVEKPADAPTAEETDDDLVSLDEIDFD